MDEDAMQENFNILNSDEMGLAKQLVINDADS